MTCVSSRTPAPAALTCYLPEWQNFSPQHPLYRALRRAQQLEDTPPGYIDALSASFHYTTASLPVAALTRHWLAGDAGDANWLCADPVWIQPDMTGVRLMAYAQMQLSMEEALRFTETLSPVFAQAGMQLEVSTPEHWHLRLSKDTSVPHFSTPEQALGEDLYTHLPAGTEGRRWRVLLNDIQMLLHQHPVNAARRAARKPQVSSVWFWGSGILPAKLHSLFDGVFTEHMLLKALAAHAGLSHLHCSPKNLASASAGWLIDLHGESMTRIECYWWPSLWALMRHQTLVLRFASGERWLHQPWHRLRLWRGGTP